MLQKVAYPDSSSGTDVVTYAYNAQGQQIWRKDQAGNIIETDFDDGGRQEARRVTTLDSDFDGAVRRIAATYNDRGMRELVTQYDSATSGSVVDEVKFSYDGWGNLTTFEQDRNSAVGASGSVDDYEVSYTYAKATTGRNTLRRATQTLPDSNVITFTYLSAGSRHDASASRVTQVKDGDTVLAAYDYNGVDRVVGTNYAPPDVMWTLYGSTSGSYPDLDRFNRVTSSRWTKDLATDVDYFDTDIAYDRGSNITSVVDNVHSGFDVIYTNDDLNRLVQAEEGTKSGSSITSRTRDQIWTLNQTGNWDVDKVDLNGDGDFTDTDEVHDARTHNDVNELTGRDIDNSGSDDYTLSYDEAGNLTDDGENYEYEWDAFYRLRKVKDTSDQSLVAEYTYNGLNYRISVHEDTDSDGDVDSNDKWFHSAYDERWRIVGTFREDDTDAKEAFIAHNAGLDGYGSGSYIDLVIARDKDANTAWTSASDGTLEERLFYCQNWRADVVALVDSSGQMMEWVKYSAYGVPFGLPGGDTDSDGDCDATDVTQVQSWIDASAYDVRGDVDLDGDVDAADKSSIAQFYVGAQGGRGVHGQTEVHRCWTGGLWLSSLKATSFRTRAVQSYSGRWASRDAFGYADSENLYEYAASNPVARRDPHGNKSVQLPAFSPGGPMQMPNRDEAQDTCEQACSNPKALSAVGCTKSGVLIVCVCERNIRGELGAKPGHRTVLSARLATFAHEMYHVVAGKMYCEGNRPMRGSNIPQAIEEMLASSQELEAWEGLRDGGICDEECWREAKPLRCSACSDAPIWESMTSSVCTDC